MKSEKLYKLAINNTTSILTGTGLTRFTIRLPLSWVDAIGKSCKLYVNDAFLLQNDGAGNTVPVDLISIACGLNQGHSFASTTNENAYAIGNFSPDLVTAQSGNIYVRVENPSDPIYIPSLPQTLEFYLINTMTGAAITIGNVANSWTASLCIQLDCDCPATEKEY